MTAIQILSRPQKLRSEIFEKESKAYELRALAMRCSSILSPAPGGGSSDHRQESLTVKALALEEEVRALEREYNEAVLTVSSVLALLSDALSIRLLKKRYLEYKTIAKLAEEEHLSERYLRFQLRLAEAAFEAASENSAAVPPPLNRPVSSTEPGSPMILLNCKK